MFRIRQVYDDTTPWNREVLRQVQAILRVQFPGLGESDIEKLPERLRNPMKHRFRSILFVAERAGAVHGFALLLHAPDLNFCYLDFISAGAGKTGGGVGGALYERVRDEALQLKSIGLFLECLPDDPALSPDAMVRKNNAARLKFYERYGALPIAGTAYETPLTPQDNDPPYLVFDDLGAGTPLAAGLAKEIVRAILERKYASTCPPSYVELVVESFVDNPVKLREPRYLKSTGKQPSVARERRIALVINDKHDIHHVRERGYVQSPVRIASIADELEPTHLFEKIPARHFSDTHIKAVHDPKFVSFLKRACEKVPEGTSVYPYVFPIRNHTRPPKSLPLRAGYYCIDTFTPLNSNAYKAAIGAVDCGLTAAQLILDGYHLAYALVRPPGHHAERAVFGGFCYFNSAAIAANYLSQFGKVAVLDVDYHHGNGTQDIFYERADVLTVSIHGPPRTTYPYFSGFEDERGTGPGNGFNLNLIVAEESDGETYRKTLSQALNRVRRYDPHFLVLSLGLDTARGDPTGSFTLGAQDFEKNGRLIAQLDLPTLVVQEGGYRTRTLGTNARYFFVGLREESRNNHRQTDEKVARRTHHP